MTGFGGYIAGGNLPKDKRIFVDPANGDDATALVYREDKPFATIQAAADAFSDGDVIECTGDIAVPSQVIFGNNATKFVLDFKEGCTVTNGFVDLQPLFDTASGVDYEIHGRGEFYNGTTASPGSNATRVFDANNGSFEIFGAKTISSYSGIPINPSAWINIRNVERIFSELSINFITGYNAIRDGVVAGFIENCNFIRPTGQGITIIQALGNDQRIVINNCVFRGGGGGGTAVNLSSSVGNLSYFEFNDCRFASDFASSYAVWCSQGENFFKFNRCHFENQNNFTVALSGTCHVDFQDCNFISTGSASLRIVSTSQEVSFSGTNKMFAGGSATISSVLQNKVRNTGVILANKRPFFTGTQVWRVGGVSEPPVAGDIYTVTANDGTQASYTTLGGDTQNDVLIGLRDACIAQGQATNNDMTDWIFTVVGAVGSQELQILASHPDYNYDLNEGETWDATTTGSDVLTTGLVAGSGGFAMVGGSFILDENLTI